MLNLILTEVIETAVETKSALDIIIGGITAIAVAGITGYFGVLPQLKNRKEKREKEASKPPIPDISEHPFFSRADVIKHHIMMTFTLENKGKEAVFKDIMMNQIVIYQQILREVCQKVDRGEVDDSNELYNLHLKAVDEITYSHYHYYKTMDYSVDEQHVLDIVMKKYVIWNKLRLEQLQDNMRTVCNSPYYNDVHTQAAVIMDLYMGIMVNTLNEGTLTLGTINGDLKGLTFKNITI